MIPEVIENGVNGFITNNVGEMKQYLVDLLNDEDMAKEIGENARKTIVEKYSSEQFVKNWDRLLTNASKITFKG